MGKPEPPAARWACVATHGLRLFISDLMVPGSELGVVATVIVVDTRVRVAERVASVQLNTLER